MQPRSIPASMVRLFSSSRRLSCSSSQSQQPISKSPRVSCGHSWRVAAPSRPYPPHPLIQLRPVEPWMICALHRLVRPSSEEGEERGRARWVIGSWLGGLLQVPVHKTGDSAPATKTTTREFTIRRHSACLRCLRVLVMAVSSTCLLVGVSIFVVCFTLGQPFACGRFKTFEFSSTWSKHYD